MTKPNILIFDFDGTLLDSFGSMKVAAKKTFLELNLPYPGDQTIMHYLHSGKQLNTILQEESYRSEIDINVSLWVDNKAYNIVECIHTIWITLIIDMFVGNPEYSVN